jgi:hypothetical protein
LGSDFGFTTVILNNTDNTGNSEPTGWEALENMNPSPKKRNRASPMPTVEPIPVPLAPDFEVQAAVDRNEMATENAPEPTDPPFHYKLNRR